MSKEFEEKFKLYTNAQFDASVLTHVDMCAMFTASRALGRREMKGECKVAVQESTVCGMTKGPMGEMYTRHALIAIEAIPEEVGEAE